MMRRALLRKHLSDIRASYWFIPGCLVIFAICAAAGSLAIDGSGKLARALSPELFPRLEVEGMRTMLSVIAQSVLGVAGVMFSITMVAVAHASSQFGPRLIGNFMRDRGNQWSLGILIATFVYALITLRSVGAISDAEAFVPHLSLLVALILALLSVGTVIYYVHHVPETINVANISAALGERLIARLKACGTDHITPGFGPDAPDGTRVCLGRAGYLQQIDLDEMTSVAERLGTRIRLSARPGAFVTPDTCVATLEGTRPEAEGLLRPCFALGRERTEDQDVTFLVDQQVEMIARALSPGVNDPQTAINCLNWLASALVIADQTGRDFGLRGSASVRPLPLGWDDLLAGSFGASWDYVRHDRLTRQRWEALLDDLAATTGRQNAARLAAFRDRITARND